MLGDSFFSTLATALYPATCQSCGALIPREELFCALCASRIKPLVSIVIPVTQAVRMTVFAAAAYNDPVRKMVTRKFARDTVASQHLGRLILRMVPLEPDDFDVIVPVPLHWTRYAWRGYNQAYEIAKVLGKELNKPVVSLVRRSKKTVFQSRLAPAQRGDNVSDAFVLKDPSVWFGDVEAYRNKRILLVDDLCTTGATLKSVGHALLPLKPLSLQAVVACRAI